MSDIITGFSFAFGVGLFIMLGCVITEAINSFIWERQYKQTKEKTRRKESAE